MKKTFMLLILVVITALALSCEKDVISYCPFCGHAGIEEVSRYDKDTGETEIHYKCTYEKCGKTFGAGQL